MRNGRRLSPAKLLKRSRMSCVRRKRVVLTVVATVKPCGDGLGPTGSRGIANSQGDGGQKELGSGESAHKPSTHRAGKAGCFPAHLLSARAFACANSSRSGSWVPAGTRPSLRPLRERGRKTEAKLGRLPPRDCQSVRDCIRKMVLPDRIELSTSPLPMECSTTELRQHVLGQESAATGGLPSGPISATSPPPVQACKAGQNEKIGAISGPKCPISRETVGILRISILISPANWPVGTPPGFGPFRVSHDPFTRAS